MRLGYLQDIDVEWLEDIFDVMTPIHHIEKPNQAIKECDMILFGGGTDVDPQLYGEQRGRYTQMPDRHRDLFERTVFMHAELLKKPMLGICRGAQFLTVMNEGTLIQHVTNHAGKFHYIEGDRRVLVNSYHHQMMYPWSSDQIFNILGFSSETLSKTYLNGQNEEIFQHRPIDCEPEIVIWPKSKSLCIQGHPEWVELDHEFSIYSKDLIRRYLLNV